MSRILVGMSGGVDSSVAAKLLIDQGHEVAGVTLQLYSKEDIQDSETQAKISCSLSDVEDARLVAEKLGIKHFVFNFQDLFAEKVITKFIHSYLEGETPNPCIDCNRYIKFDTLIEHALVRGYDFVATGHYARIQMDGKTGRLNLLKGSDLTKDQSYVLYCLSQQQLAHSLFPLGGMSKSEIRFIAENAGLINARKSDSQDICFVPDGDYAGFIERRVPGTIKAGNFIDINGTVIGQHRGITRYTIGQRRGIATAFGKPMYVAAKNAQENTVTLGENQDLEAQTLIARDINLIAINTLEESIRVTAKIRYNQKEQSAVIRPCTDGNIEVEFDEPQRAIAPGQAVVFYQGDTVIGGGTI